MPELPEVETVLRGLEKVLLNRTLLSVDMRRADLRFPLPTNMHKALVHQRITGMERRAKYMLIHFEHGQTLLIHLGMSGRMTIDNNVDDGIEQTAKHDHVIFKTDGGQRIRYNDARRFGMMDIVATAKTAQHKLLKNLGVEPLGDAFTAAALHTQLQNKKIAIKLAIMDQAVVVGVGNIYASEALYGAGINPMRGANTLNQNECKKLVAAIQNVLKRAIEKGGSTLRDYVQSDGELGYFQHEFAVYGRSGLPCKNCTCEGGIQKITQGGRSTFFCAVTQV
jgi:formamidopyrimidine-DNA glycosylase